MIFVGFIVSLNRVEATAWILRPSDRPLCKLLKDLKHPSDQLAACRIQSSRAHGKMV